MQVSSEVTNTPSMRKNDLLTIILCSQNIVQLHSNVIASKNDSTQIQLYDNLSQLQ